MISFHQFKTLLNESFSELTKEEFISLSKNPGNTLVHFSNSETFPPNPSQRGFATAFNADVVGSKLGISVLKPKEALFFWFLKDVELPILSSKTNLGSLWQRRLFVYLIDCPEGTNVFRVSNYSEKKYESDILKLKERGYNFLTSKLPMELKYNILHDIEFSNQGLSLPQNIVNVFDRLKFLWEVNGEDFTKDIESFKLGPAKVRTLPEDQVKKLIYTVIGVKKGFIKEKNLEFTTIDTSTLPWYSKYSELKLSFSSSEPPTLLKDFLPKKLIDIEKTLEKSSKDLDFSKLVSNLKLTPDQYIEEMNVFIQQYYKIYRPGDTPLDINHPAWKLWLTILFFSKDEKESWRNIWLSLGYNVIVDDDPRTQITPGLEKMMVANIGGSLGIERQLIRLDNERIEVLFLDPSTLTNVRRFTLSELQPQESSQ